MDTGKNQVKVAVKPYADQDRPVLSARYLSTITEYLEQHRLLSTVITVVQPIYIAVDVSGTIYVKKHYEDCREKIEKLIRETLDYVNGSQNFGTPMHFNELFRKIEELDCVQYIYDLALQPQDRQHTSMDGMDVRPADNCLLYPGEVYLNISTYMEN